MAYDECAQHGSPPFSHPKSPLFLCLNSSPACQRPFHAGGKRPAQLQMVFSQLISEWKKITLPLGLLPSMSVGNLWGWGFMAWSQL